MGEAQDHKSVQTEADFLKLLAERPHDRALRLVFSDWLLERGDPRGEFIALAHKQAPSRKDLSRLEKLQDAGQAAWLGPLAALADTSRTRWEGGFLDTLAVLRGVMPATVLRLVGEPRLSTVRRLVLPVDPPLEQWVAFLSHPVLAGLKRLSATAPLLTLLQPARLPFVLDTIGLATWDTFEGELEQLAGVPVAQTAACLELSPQALVNGHWVGEVASSVLSQVKSWRFAEEVRLLAPLATPEGVAAWLAVGANTPGLRSSWPRGLRWTVEFAESALHTVFQLSRSGDGAFDTLQVDVRGKKGPIDLQRRIDPTGAVLLALKGSQLKRVEVELPAGEGLSTKERNMLRQAVRRLRSVETLKLGDDEVDP